MKKLFTFLMFSCFSFAAFAQPSSGIAPNFTIKDLDGNEYTLYDYLNDGKFVILDIYATWCGPCWNIHENKVLENIHETYGPNGTDEVIVMSIEGDPSTGIECMYGPENCTVNGQPAPNASIGDWVTGVEFIVGNDDNLSRLYELTGYPSIYIICPNLQVVISEDFGATTVETLENYLNDCPEPFEGLDLAAHFSLGSEEKSCDDVTFTPSVIVQNNGTEDITKITAELFLNGTMIQEKDWTGTLNEYNIAVIDFDETSQAGGTEMNVNIVSVNDTEDDISNNNSTANTIGAAPSNATTRVTFEITTDFWPEETTWELRDDTGVLIASNEDEGTLTCDETYTQNYVLELGRCYVMNVADAYGDGILNGPMNPGHGCTTANGTANMAMGAISLRSELGDIYTDIAYGIGTDIYFTVSETSDVERIDFVEEVTLFPNPVSDLLNVNFTLEKAAELKIDVINTMGQQVQSLGASTYNNGLNTLDVNTSNLPNGIYLLNIQSEEGTISQKFTVSK